MPTFTKIFEDSKNLLNDCFMPSKTSKLWTHKGAMNYYTQHILNLTEASVKLIIVRESHLCHMNVLF